MATGRVKKVGPNWVVIINLPYDPVKGTYPYKWMRGFKTKQDANNALIKELATRADSDNPDWTVKAFLEYWQDDLDVAPRTLANYKYGTSRAISHFGNVKLDKLKPHHFEAMYKSLSDSLSSSSIHTIHRALRAAFHRAVTLGYINKSPLDGVKLPTLRSERRETLSGKQAFQLLDFMRKKYPSSWMGCLIAFYTGFRKGEILGLRWSDIDMQTRKISIKQTRQRVKGEMIIGEPKTPLSKRSIIVSDALVTELQTWRKLHQEHTLMRGESWNDDALVIRHVTGELLDPDTLTHNLHKAEKALELPLVTVHDLRHTHATMLLEAGVDLKNVSERLGHASIRTTGDVYAHVTDKMQRQTVDLFDQALENNS